MSQLGQLTARGRGPLGRIHLLLKAGLFLCLMGLPDAALAETNAASSEPQTQRHRMEWTYPHFRWWEYGASVAVTGANVYLNFAKLNYPTKRWNGPLLIDEDVRHGLRAPTQQQRDKLDRLSDYFWHPTQYYSLIESVVVPLAFDDFNTEAAAQMTLINLQVLGTAGLVTRLAHLAVGRSRPSLRGCRDEPDAENSCEAARGSSFFSGHTSMAAVGAGLACSHHLALPFYGSGWPNMLPCALLTGTSITVGALRVAADKHWASDVFVGYALGYGMGIGLPWLLHYQFDEKEKEDASPWSRAAVIPWADANGFGLGVSGLL